MSDERVDEAAGVKARRFADRVDGMTGEEMRSLLVSNFTEIAGLNRRISEQRNDMVAAAADRPDSPEKLAEATVRRLAIKEKLFDEAAKNDLPIQLVRRLALDDESEIHAAIDEIAGAIKGRQADERRRYDAANGRSAATLGPARQHGLGSYDDLLSLDNRQLSNLSPRALDHIMERELRGKKR